MINLEEVLNNEVLSKKVKLSPTNNLQSDFLFWCEKFESFKVNQGVSTHTLKSLMFICRSLEEFNTLDKDTISNYKILDDIDSAYLNKYLDYLSQYKINSEYGLLEYRLSILFRCSDKIKQQNSIKGFKSLIDKCSDAFTPDEMNTFEYMINDFALYMEKYPVDFNMIDNEYVKGYIANIEKLTNKSMQQRKASLQSLLSFIDKSVKKNHFKNMYWELKEYPLVKQKQKKYAFDEQFLENFLSTMQEYVKNANSNARRGDIELIAYKNTFLILVMLHGGCRSSEAVNLKYDDVELDRTKDGTGVYRLSLIGKGNKFRYTYIKQELLKEHLEYLIEHRGVNQYISGKPKGDKPLSTRQLFRFAKKMFELSGSEEQGLHIFRHHFASSFAEKKKDIKSLQEILGHSNINTTMIYSDVRDESIKEAQAR